ncbi:MAG: methyltransferase domain-containing protein [Myxococcaceae bacterium]|nr:methyltransferase domain-containing protein [Myxococcaceae bacterium]
MAKGYRALGALFDQVAADYDAGRPDYPRWLFGGLRALPRGAAVLEVGCGTGQATGRLLERGYRVVAVEPGAQMIAFARARHAARRALTFVHGRFEDFEPRRSGPRSFAALV